MSSNPTSSATLFLIVNLLIFSIADACGSCSGGMTKPKYTPSPPASSVKCPIDTLKLGVCADVLNGLINLDLGKPPKEPCCTLIDGLVDLEAALCLCTVIKANVLGIISLNLPINLSLLLNYCGKGVPSGFQCP